MASSGRLNSVGSVYFSENLLLAAAAVTTGLCAAVGVWLFKRAIFWSGEGSFGIVLGIEGGTGAWPALFVPALGGFVVGLLLHWKAEKHTVTGMEEARRAVEQAGGRLEVQNMPFEALTAAIGIGMGASIGPEEPAVQIGANFGSLWGDRFGLGDLNVRLLIASGVAAGIASAFNAPIAGIFFAIEIVLAGAIGHAAGAIVLAAVAAAALTQALSGSSPAFDVPVYELKSAWELLLYAGLGIGAGLCAAAYICLIKKARAAFNLWPVPLYFKTTLAGLLVGIAGVFFPQILGVGYGFIESVLRGTSISVFLLLGLLLLKSICAALCLGAGFRGGTIAPALFIGCVLGAIFGQAFNYIGGSLQVAPPAYALVGMAAVLAGAVDAPLTAILLLFEMTNDYRIMVPVMLSVVCSRWTAQISAAYCLSLGRGKKDRTV